MPKKAIYELIRCIHFSWRLSRRNKVWYADGRSNPVNVGRHSLETQDKLDAMETLHQLDQACAVKHGLIERQELPVKPQERLTLVEGRKLYEAYIGRSRITGGVAPATQKRYRTTFNNFIPWALKTGLMYFDQVDKATLIRYAGHLQHLGRSSKTQENELTTIKQCVRWLIEEERLPGREPIKLKLKKFESLRAYCFQPQQVAAMLQHCRKTEGLTWLGDVITGLACTGMRIAELTGLQWSDVDLGGGRITLTDETGHQIGSEPRRALKSGRSRSFPIEAELLSVLERLPRKLPYVFLGPTQRRLKPDFVRRKLVQYVIKPLTARFPTVTGRQGFVDGRLHSFRHYFVSQCATQKVAELVVMKWVGHSNSAMVRHYFHLSDEESRRQMRGLDLLGGAAGCSDGEGSRS